MIKQINECRLFKLNLFDKKKPKTKHMCPEHLQCALVAVLTALQCTFTNAFYEALDILLSLSSQRSWMGPDRWAADSSSKLWWVDCITVTLEDFPLLLWLNADQAAVFFSSCWNAIWRLMKGKSQTDDPLCHSWRFLKEQIGYRSFYGSAEGILT